jgi:CRISPR-associated protein (TIGR03984 family)
MKIDYSRIGAAFPEKAWAYAEQYDSVQIGKWDSARLVFDKPLDERYLLVLRIFSEERELRFTSDKCRDTLTEYESNDFISRLADSKYFLYGEHSEFDGVFTKLREDRGGELYFPAKLNFPNGIVAIKLGIKNFVRYNCVPVLPKEEDFDFGLSASGAGALETVDYAYTGFYYTYAGGKKVDL